MKLVVIESPYSGNVDRNVSYARSCLRDCLKNGEAPIASHLLYTQDGVLDDGIQKERELGIRAGFAWNKHAEYVVVYRDYGITPGMQRGIDFAKENNIPVIYRRLYEYC
jgi:murein DD-endopeptidase MepM/ murein hydrolase activator NlpD